MERKRLEGGDQLAAQRWAAALTDELRRSDEELWRRVFAERYESIRNRYAPRTAWRTRRMVLEIVSATSRQTGMATVTDDGTVVVK